MKDRKKQREEWQVLVFALALISCVLAAKVILAFFWQSRPFAGWVYLGAMLLCLTLCLLTAGALKMKNRKDNEKANKVIHPD